MTCPALTTCSGLARKTFVVVHVADDEEEEGKSENNPYQDENYPELEFIDYSDPNYSVDQGVSDEFFSQEEADEETIEQMREDRRRRNDEFQFETYFRDMLQGGTEYKGEWTIYKSSTFVPEIADDSDGAMPRLVRVRKPLKVKTRGYRISVESDSEFPVDSSRLCHEEVVEKESEEEEIREDIKTYWPEQMKAFDFRGQQGNMCVGKGYTICTSVPLLEDASETEGPFAEMRTELGISKDDLRMRVKLDFAVIDEDKTKFLSNDAKEAVPPLHLKTLTVCREALDQWPMNGSEGDLSEADLSKAEALFGIPGADGGLYDPPPVGSDAQAAQYMMMDLEGGATILFPFLVDQDPEAFSGKGWVTSLDWTPGAMRYQVDRKVQGGKRLMELRSLELSEVRSADAATYRPRDGGLDMRQ